MNSDTPLDYAVFQLSPKRSRCELFISSNGNTEKLASGLVKPFVAHLKVAEEQIASDTWSVKLEAGRQPNTKTWFTRGTLERFVRFVSTPEVLELVNNFDAEMSQLEAARKIYAEERGDQLSGAGKTGVTNSADMTKKELLRAIDVRLVTVQQDLTTACARAASAGFNGDTVFELQMFAEFFGGHRLSEACIRYISLCERRADLISPWRCRTQNGAVRSSYGSDMSIDEEPSSPQSSGLPPTQTRCQENPSMSQQRNPSSQSFPAQCASSRESSIERDDSNKQSDSVVEVKKEESSCSGQTESTHTSQHVRRLSVQDRISLFENKQKETSGSGGKPVVRKSVELRRLSSDVSSAPATLEKAVLRRWSGASDMSIDLSAEKDAESPLCSASGLVSKSEDRKALSSDDTVSSSVKMESGIISGAAFGQVGNSGFKDASFSKHKDGAESSMSSSILDTAGFDGWKDQKHLKTQTKSFSVRSADQEDPEEFRSSPDIRNKAVSGSGDQGKLKGGSLNGGELGTVKGRVVSEPQAPNHQVALRTQIRTSYSKGGAQVEISNWKEQSESRDQFAAQSFTKAPPKTVGDSGQFEGLAGSKIREAFAAHYKGTERSSLSFQSSGRPIGVTMEVEKKELPSSEKISSTFASKVEDSGHQKMKFQRQISAHEECNKALPQRAKSNSIHENSRTLFSGKLTAEPHDGSDSFSTPNSEQMQKLRLKGNQELNDELKIKANELEKLFAELHFPGDQSNSSRRGRLANIQGEPAANISYRKSVADMTPQLSDNYPSSEPTGTSNNTIKFSASALMTMVEDLKHGDVKLSFSEGSRGKLYDMYMLKRDAKLREEWSSNRAEKEATLRSMQDSFDRSRAEMKAKFSSSTNGQDSISPARRRTDRLRSFSSRSIMKREQNYIDFGDSEEDEDTPEFPEHNPYHEDGTSIETSFGDGVSKNASSKKLLPTKSSSTSISRSSASRSATKSSILSSGKRRMQSENPLVQSVPNFFDMRREYTKPSSAAGKTTRPQPRNYTRSKSTSEEAPFVKDKSCRSQSLRKSSANSGEVREITLQDSDDAVLTPLKFDKEVPENFETNSYLNKGSPADFIDAPCITMHNEGENNILFSGADFMVNTIKGKEEEFDTIDSEGHKKLDNGKLGLGLESDKLMNSGSENGDVERSTSQMDHTLGAELPTLVQDWTIESLPSWNSRTQHPFSYPNEISDIDASVDSPVGSPASWNSNSLSQIENDAAQMRKKWGMAQKPMWAANSSNNISRKDMAKGFKRLLKFGRKNRGSESLVDWISATTSEGDDDTEDGRDPANRSSDDLRKSRMGFTQGKPSDDSFTESEILSEQAPRSFFSLTTFRGKGGDPRPRQSSSGEMPLLKFL